MSAGGEQMDDRMRKVETKVDSLQQWRSDVVDPHIDDSRRFIEEMTRFATTYQAEVVTREKLENERHRSNSWKLNVITGIVGFGVLIITIIAVVIAYATYRKESLTVPVSITSQIVEPEAAYADIPATIQRR